MTAVGSSLYECRVMHHRFAPKAHRFAYRIFMFAVDLDDLDRLGRGIPILSVNRRNLYSFREDDYLPTGEKLHNASAAPSAGAAPGLRERVHAYLGERGVSIPGGRVVLLTLPRVAGYLFNPVSFYFCTDAAGRPAAAIAEVTNTFHEMKPYFLGPDAIAGEEGEFRLRVPKHFYVSPFSDVDVAFDFRLRNPGEGLSIQIDDYTGEERTLTSVLTGRRTLLSLSNLAWCSVKYPLITVRVILLIHLHALLLRMKRVPWFRKAARPLDQRDLYRPHGSISTTPIT
jgi:DUF1365 family protein